MKHLMHTRVSLTAISPDARKWCQRWESNPGHLRATVSPMKSSSSDRWAMPTYLSSVQLSKRLTSRKRDELPSAFLITVGRWRLQLTTKCLEAREQATYNKRRASLFSCMPQEQNKKQPTSDCRWQHFLNWIYLAAWLLSAIETQSCLSSCCLCYGPVIRHGMMHLLQFWPESCTSEVVQVQSPA